MHTNLTPVWADINETFPFQADPLTSPFFQTSGDFPDGMPVVLRIRASHPQVLLPGEGRIVRESLAPCSAEIRNSPRQGDMLYICLPAGVTWEGMHRLLSPAHDGGRVVDCLVRALDQRFDEELTDDHTASEAEVQQLMGLLAQVLQLFVPGTVYCREVASLHSHVTARLVGEALDAGGGDSAVARELILQEFLGRGLVCAFRPAELDRRIAALQKTAQRS